MKYIKTQLHTIAIRPYLSQLVATALSNPHVRLSHARLVAYSITHTNTRAFSLSRCTTMLLLDLQSAAK